MRAWRCRIAVGALLVVGSPTWAASPEAPRRVIIDTDPGTDDAMAILLALNAPQLRVEALTVVPGNVTAAQGLENALKLVSLAGRPDIPVAPGAQKPLLQKLVTAETHGADGLAGVSLPPARSAPDTRFAPDLIIELVHRYPHEIALVTLGPLTNVALALSKDPSIAGLVKEVVLMGGAITGGNVDAVAEFNIYVDPEAAQVVFQGGFPLTMVGLEIGRKALFRREHLALLQKTHGTQNDFAARVLEYLVNLCETKYGLKGAPLLRSDRHGGGDRPQLDNDTAHACRRGVARRAHACRDRRQPTERAQPESASGRQARFRRDRAPCAQHARRDGHRRGAIRQSADHSPCGQVKACPLGCVWAPQRRSAPEGLSLSPHEFSERAEPESRVVRDVVAEPAQVAGPEDRQHALVRGIHDGCDVGMDAHVPAEPVGPGGRLLRENRRRGDPRANNRTDVLTIASWNWTAAERVVSIIRDRAG